MSDTIALKGRIFLNFEIEAVTGLHIGGSDTGIAIGGVDKTIIRDPLSNQPYIPGSSLKGKMRSLLEKYHNKPQNKTIGHGKIHSCDNSKDYQSCEICRVFGVPGEENFSTPTRLFVRDVPLEKQSADELIGKTELPFSEVKTEVSIDRVTSKANPRQMERVPAGARFADGEMVYSVYEGMGCSLEQDLDMLEVLIEGMQLLEDDYLGGLGSRGSGKVRFQKIRVKVRGVDLMAEPQVLSPEKGYSDLDALKSDYSKLKEKLLSKLV